MFIMHRLLLAVFLALTITACEQIVLDPLDPLEKYGPYRFGKAGVSMDTATSGSNIAGTLYYPNGTFPANSLPLLVLLPGYGLHYWDYEAYAYHLASHGHIVLGMDYVETSSDNTIGKHDDKAQQVQEAIDYVLLDSSKNGLVDSSKIAVMGHSLGGKIAFYAAAQDSRIKAIIALDPSNAGGPPCLIAPDNCANYPVAANPARGEVGIVSNISAASLIFRSEPDASNPAAEFNARYFYYGSDGKGSNGAPSPAFYINMGSASHASYIPKLVSFTPAIVKRDAVAWLQTIFAGTDNSLYFTGSKMQADIKSGRVIGYESR